MIKKSVALVLILTFLFVNCYASEDEISSSTEVGFSVSQDKTDLDFYEVKIRPSYDYIKDSVKNNLLLATAILIFVIIIVILIKYKKKKKELAEKIKKRQIIQKEIAEKKVKKNKPLKKRK